jgi:hypothetical protein
MPRAISLVVNGAAGVGDVFAGVKVDAADVPPGVGAGLDPVFVEAGAREQPLMISSRQHMVNMTVCVCACWRIPCPSKDLFLTLSSRPSLNVAVKPGARKGRHYVPAS